MFKLDDPGIAFALLAIIVGLRLALFVAERFLTARAAMPEAPLLSPDDPAEETPLQIDAAASTQPAKSPADSRSLRFVTELLDAALIAVILVFFIIRPLMIQAFFIPSESMVPTLQKGDKLLVTKYNYFIRNPKRGEVVVFHAPKVALDTSSQPYDPQHPTDYVKRVVGVPGDHIHIVAHDGVYVNGKRLQERYVAALPNYHYPSDPRTSDTYDFPQYPQDPQVKEALKNDIRNGELIVPPDHFFVLGDNRTMSHDSHVWGLVEKKALVGKALMIFWPPARFGVVH